jgi:hypothetical protein
MRLDTAIRAEALVAALNLPGTAHGQVMAILTKQEIKPFELIDLRVSVSADEAYDAVEAAGLLPEPENEVEPEDLIDGLKAALAGDRTMAVRLLSRAVSTSPDLQSRVEDLLYARAPRDPNQPALALVA